MKNSNSNKQPIELLPALTALRFFAAMHVVLYHLHSNGYALFTADQASSTAQNLIIQIYTRYIQTGYISVSLFFVLSGFILAHSNIDNKFNKNKDILNFYVARFSRIYPVYLLGLIAISPIMLGMILSEQKTIAITGIGLLLNIFLIQAWIGPAAMSWNTPGWSLSVELFFYSIFPFLFKTFSKLSSRNLVLISTFIILLGFTPPVLYILLKPENVVALELPHAYYSQAPILVALKFLPLARAHEFILGIMTGLLYSRSKTILKTPYSAMSLVLFTISIIAPLYISDEYFPLLHNGLMAPVFAMLIFSLAKSKANKYIANNGVMDTLGKSSFSLYIIHGPILLSLKNIAIYVNHDLNLLTTIAVTSLSILISVVIFKHYEEPARLFVKRILMRNNIKSIS